MSLTPFLFNQCYIVSSPTATPLQRYSHSAALAKLEAMFLDTIICALIVTVAYSYYGYLQGIFRTVCYVCKSYLRLLDCQTLRFCQS
ncbi:hypothetical protein BDN70DRAFT_881596 [Pholiota conissans]|uniref:Uncharacterized protein n=1 Tax=Pholiota conissans TaxID=109636 RepID=A0A9P5YXM6_9AGAR|nr:hypothetical protein BDN70DRAFT_881596 [Pholiota conissans]